jgi:PadR family transcriptional regulator PadR
MVPIGAVCIYMSTNNSSDSGRRPEASTQPRNWLQPFLLLSIQQWQSHGYELMQRLSVFGFEAMDPGSVYRTLRQLERDGLVSSDWDTNSSHGPARRVYSLTESGETYLQTWASALRGYQSMLDSFFKSYATDAGDRRGEM